MTHIAKHVAEQNTVLRGIVGSKALGIDTTNDDRDEMGIFVEPPAHVYGIDGAIDHYIYRTAKEGERSGPGDLDLAMYSLRKFCRLACQGNPSILLLLHLNDYETMTHIGEDLLSIRNAFVSKEAGHRFLGYLRAQKAKLNVERSPCVSRPELVALYGYDTKFAAYAVRLGLQGIEYLTDCTIALPMKESGHIVDIRKGKYSLGEILDEIRDVENELTRLVHNCALLADRKTINDFVVGAHEMHWFN